MRTALRALMSPFPHAELIIPGVVVGRVPCGRCRNLSGGLPGCWERVMSKGQRLDKLLERMNRAMRKRIDLERPQVALFEVCADSDQRKQASQPMSMTDLDRHAHSMGWRFKRDSSLFGGYYVADDGRAFEMHVVFVR